ncbi:hypothetical protein NPIL_117601 [Nephila pilipes]|uniref:Uncharacterized protein n=1 Tax=Nephila pilipes TaxID=299642 RepID=A0A8X6QQQ6_NEPPI|nr:hypothetical protein NPIL_117601 [Nephila pilipes]
MVVTLLCLWLRISMAVTVAYTSALGLLLLLFTFASPFSNMAPANLPFFYIPSLYMYCLYLPACLLPASCSIYSLLVCMDLYMPRAFGAAAAFLPSFFCCLLVRRRCCSLCRAALSPLLCHIPSCLFLLLLCFYARSPLPYYVCYLYILSYHLPALFSLYCISFFLPAFRCLRIYSHRHSFVLAILSIISCAAIPHTYYLPAYYFYLLAYLIRAMLPYAYSLLFPAVCHYIPLYFVQHCIVTDNIFGIWYRTTGRWRQTGWTAGWAW